MQQLRWAVLTAVFIVTTIGMGQTAQAKSPDFERKIEAVTVGKVRLSYRNKGAPANQAANLKVYVQCEGLRNEQEIGNVNLCGVNRYKFKPESKLFTLEYIDSRTDSRGNVICDRNSSKKLDLGKICNDIWKDKLTPPDRQAGRKTASKG